MERVIANHFNNRQDQGIEGRKFSPIRGMKNFNNWIKSILIQKYSRCGDVVLDFCCGKGGDQRKFDIAKIRELVGLDISETQIKDAKNRYNDPGSSRKYNYKASYFVADCFSVNIEEVIPNALHYQFDVVSCQFALHYSFESESKAHTAIRNASLLLKEGGYFFGTIPNAYRLIKKLKDADGLTFGNSIFQVIFEQKQKYPIFGHKYVFHLEDAIDSCPEFVINPNVLERKATHHICETQNIYLIYLLYISSIVLKTTLKRIANSFGLRLVYLKDFHHIYQEYIELDQFKDLWFRMKVTTGNERISQDEWDAIDLYSAFVFKKDSSIRPATTAS